jgi:hypothetical protein
MRTVILAGFFGVLATTLARGGDAPKEAPFRELSSEELSPLLGDWQAVIATKDGWQGTLRANLTLKRNHPEVSEFHALAVFSWDLTHTDAKKVTTQVKGTDKWALLPCQKGKQRHVQFMRDHQVLQKEFFEEVLDIRPLDKAAQKGLAELRPNAKNTASFSTAGDSWTLETSPALLEILPKGGNSGPKIDWDGKIVWKKTKAK